MKKLLFAVLFALAAMPAAAGESSYFKLSFWGKAAVGIPNHIGRVTGLDLGVGSSAQNVTGVQLDVLYANAAERARGVQWSFGFSRAEDLRGYQTAIYGQTRTGAGAMNAVINNSLESFSGVQLGWINVARRFEGLQFSFVNYAADLNGLQFGVVNYAEHVKGLQIGLVNIARNGWLPVMVLVNGRF